MPIKASEIFNEQKGMSASDVLLNKYAQEAQTAPEVKKPNYFQRVAGDYKKAGEDIITSVKKGASGEQNPLSTGLQTAGEVAGAAFAPLTELLTPIIGKAVETKAGQKVIQTVKPAVDKYSEWAKAHPEASKNLESVVDIAGLLVGEKPIQEGAQKVINTGTNIINKNEVIKAAEKTAKKTDLFTSTLEDAKDAAGRITQAKTKDIPKVQRALTQINTTGVKTYGELSQRIKQEIPTIAEKVDNEFLKDPTVYKLEDLVVKAKTKGGQEIATDYVTRSLNDLEELYTKIGDDVSAANIKEVANKAKTEGLTRKEVNDIARVYGQEFSQKAFSKTGDPLTSVNAQAYETTRSGLKDVARQGLSKEAQNLDSQLSDLITLRTYNDKMIEAVTKLQNRIQERGLGEKIGHYTTKTLDMLSGGTIRGVIGGLLPRGAGYKVLNALDLEEALKKNLKLIEKASNAKSDLELVKAVAQLKPFQLDKATTFEKSPIVKGVKDYIKNPKMGNSIEDVSKSKDLSFGVADSVVKTVHPDDISLMKKFIDSVRIKAPLSDSEFNMVEKLAQKFKVNMDGGLSKSANLFEKILKGEVKVPKTKK